MHLRAAAVLVTTLSAAPVAFAAPSITTLTVSSERLSQPIPVRVLRTEPAKATETIVYLVFGTTYLDHGGLPTRIAGRADAAAVAFVELPVLPPSDHTWASVRLESTHYRDTVFDVLLPEVERQLGFSEGERHLLGYSAGAVLALDLAADGRARFDRAALQSPGWMNWDAAAQAIGENYIGRAIAGAAGACGTATWFMWGDGDDPWEAGSRENGAQVIAALRECGGHVVDGGRWPGDHGFHLVRDSLIQALGFLLED